MSESITRDKVAELLQLAIVIPLFKLAEAITPPNAGLWTPLIENSLGIVGSVAIAFFFGNFIFRRPTFVVDWMVDNRPVKEDPLTVGPGLVADVTVSLHQTSCVAALLLFRWLGKPDSSVQLRIPTEGSFVFKDEYSSETNFDVRVLKVDCSGIEREDATLKHFVVGIRPPQSGPHYKASLSLVIVKNGKTRKFAQLLTRRVNPVVNLV